MDRDRDFQQGDRVKLTQYGHMTLRLRRGVTGTVL